MLTERQSKGCFCARLLEKISQLAKAEAERDMWKAKYHQAMADRGKEVRDARDPALQDLQCWMRERRGELFRWTESPDIPAENNRAERGVPVATDRPYLRASAA